MNSKRSRPRKYPWDKWLKPTNLPRTLQKGIDYDCSTKSMDVAIRARALIHNVWVSVSRDFDSDTVTIKSVEPRE